jgi:hypothetical protein
MSRLVLLIGLLAPTAARAGGETEPAARHWRIAAPQGVIHVLRPAGYRQAGAGIVLYVHGFNTTVDRTWREDDLAAQLVASRRNAIFIAVAGPRAIAEGVRFPDLDRVLRLVARRTGLRLPRGRLVAVGHSAGYWTIASWLDHPRLDHVILLDGLYGFIGEYRRWIAGHARRRLTLVARGTRRQSRRLIRGLSGVAVREGVPARLEGFTRRERRARIVLVGSQYGHDAIVSSGRVIPMVLRLTRLRSVRAGSAGRGTPGST